ncbi:hypothetical protein, partial [Actinotignum sanguinis]|uniref:hypothetical protein n=1 Tax=Actinotignum sanguinis TaxID=1445614 RepID=UPI00237ED848
MTEIAENSPFCARFCFESDDAACLTTRTDSGIRAVYACFISDSALTFKPSQGPDLWWYGAESRGETNTKSP